MTDNFKTIKDAFEKAGIDVKTAEYSITEYSLNTELSFKFSNTEELLSFLDITDAAKAEKINSMIIEAGINTGDFFYVNFYKPKVAEL